MSFGKIADKMLGPQDKGLLPCGSSQPGRPPGPYLCTGKSTGAVTWSLQDGGPEVSEESSSFQNNHASFKSTVSTTLQEDDSAEPTMASMFSGHRVHTRLDPVHSILLRDGGDIAVT